jgi:hypothetical protein
MYAVDIPDKVADCIREGFVNEAAYADGEIFRKIRFYQRSQNLQAENKWWARLTLGKTKDLQRLLKNQSLAEAFERLVDFPGFWSTVQLGTLHRILPLRCNEVRLAQSRVFTETNDYSGAASLSRTYIQNVVRNLRPKHSKVCRRCSNSQVIGAPSS